MKRNMVETILGAVVLLVAGCFLFFFYRTTDIKPATGYELIAEFDKIDGLQVGTPVRISGVKVGQVTRFEVNRKNYRADVYLNIQDDVKLPVDSSAVIASAGLLDGKVMTLTPGGDEEMLKPGGHIEYTQSSVSLEQMLGQFIFSVSKNNKKSDDDSDEGDAAPAPQKDAPAKDAPAPDATPAKDSTPQTDSTNDSGDDHP